MKPASFDYHAAGTVEEATALLAEYGDEAKVLAGGQSLLPLLALRLGSVEHVIDVNRIEALADVRDGEGVELGAVTCHRAAERSPRVREHAPVLCGALHFVGHTAIRNRGTIGGSIAHGDPAAELPAVLLALEGSVVASSAHGSHAPRRYGCGSWRPLPVAGTLSDIRIGGTTVLQGTTETNDERRHNG